MPLHGLACVFVCVFLSALTVHGVCTWGVPSVFPDGYTPKECDKGIRNLNTTGECIIVEGQYGGHFYCCVDEEHCGKQVCSTFDIPSPVSCQPENPRAIFNYNFDVNSQYRNISVNPTFTNVDPDLWYDCHNLDSGNRIRRFKNSNMNHRVQEPATGKDDLYTKINDNLNLIRAAHNGVSQNSAELSFAPVNAIQVLDTSAMTATQLDSRRARITKFLMRNAAKFGSVELITLPGSKPGVVNNGIRVVNDSIKLDHTLDINSVQDYLLMVMALEQFETVAIEQALAMIEKLGWKPHAVIEFIRSKPLPSPLRYGHQIHNLFKVHRETVIAFLADKFNLNIILEDCPRQLLHSYYYFGALFSAFSNGNRFFIAEILSQYGLGWNSYSYANIIKMNGDVAWFQLGANLTFVPDNAWTNPATQHTWLRDAKFTVTNPGEYHMEFNCKHADPESTNTEYGGQFILNTGRQFCLVSQQSLSTPGMAIEYRLAVFKFDDSAY